jgi:arylsulfatase A-like enzyme
VWVLAGVLVYAATIEYGFLTHDRNPWCSALLLTSFDELSRLASLWWRDALVTTLLIVALSGHFTTSLQEPRPRQRVAVWSVVTAAYLLAGIDCGYFVATRSSITGAELLYAFRSPADALLLARWSVSTSAVLALLVPLIAFAAAVLILRRIGHRAEVVSHFNVRPTPVGLLLWPVLALAIAAPARPGDLAIENLTRDTLWTLPFEAFIAPITAAIKENAISREKPEYTAPEVSPELVRRSGARRLNVVIVILESYRTDATTLHSPKLRTTPFLAELARESLVVDHMYAVVPRTSAAWMAILAGQYPADGGAIHRWAENTRGEPFDASLPALLRTQGYTSAFFTTATLQFEENAEVMRALQFDEVVTREQIAAPAHGAVTPFGWEDRAALPVLEEWLDARAAAKTPFLLTVMTNVGHQPYRLPPGFAPYNYPHVNPAHLQYLNCVRYVDDYLREIVSGLRRRHLLENTVLVVLGDHGEEFGEHGGSVRGQVLYEESLRVPMLIRLPKSAGRKGHIGGLRQQIDVLPTVTEILGLDLKDSALPGRSILSAPGHRTLFFSSHASNAQIAMRDGDRKYVHLLDTGETRVFDLAEDPGEDVDLHPDIASEALNEAESELQSWHTRVLHTYLHASAR